jgi:hypothetical protein
MIALGVFASMAMLDQYLRPSGRTERLHTRMFTDVQSQRAFSHDHAKKIVEIVRLGSRTVNQAVYTGRNRDG